MKKSILLLIVFILTSCATVQTEATFTKAPLQEEATVYLFRKGLYNGALLQTAKIYMDGKYRTQWLFKIENTQFHRPVGNKEFWKTFKNEFRFRSRGVLLFLCPK